MSVIQAKRSAAERSRGITSRYCRGIPRPGFGRKRELTMPDLDFRILGVEAANYGIAPLLHFKLEVTNQPADEVIQSVMLQAQIQIHPTLRSYQPEEKEKLGELFGTPDRWGQTLRARLWTHANVNVPQFSGRTEAILSVPCTFDLNVSATKYFYALEDGEAPLLFLFSGTIFYQNADERLQIQQVSWNKESTYRLPDQRMERDDGSPLSEHGVALARARFVRAALRFSTA